MEEARRQAQEAREAHDEQRLGSSGSSGSNGLVEDERLALTDLGPTEGDTEGQVSSGVTVKLGHLPELLYCDGCMYEDDKGNILWAPGTLRKCPVCKSPKGVHCVNTLTIRCLRCTKL